MKIILSRKGFDSSVQGGGSASFVFKNDIYPLPIPEVGNEIKYEDLKFDGENNLLKVMRDLNINQFTECHFDPYISSKMIPNDSPINSWKRSLGQCDIAQSILKAEDIQKGDLFIFFGWFNQLKLENGKFKYVNFSGYHKEGVQMIYGYLEVGDDIINIEKNDNQRADWVQSHPHYIQRNQFRGENVIYTANKELTFNVDKPGAGLFKFDQDLILTEGNSTRTNWILPELFHPSNEVEIKYLPLVNWKPIRNGKTRIKASSRGQEFVVIKDKNKAIEAWAKNLINSHVVDE